ncbi:serine/arginine-rich splicing factor 6-like [Salvelinus alpinus]|uniref:serine/arginine-rich splicing factor 6-like n=1 Tax=Salvelinus alpinus TaxID=8036 RepID=UPI0039FDC291
MRQAGEGTYADTHKEWTNERVIEFRSSSDMRRALDKLYSTDINERKICLVEDKPRRRRSSSGSCSRSRNRRRSLAEGAAEVLAATPGHSHGKNTDQIASALPKNSNTSHGWGSSID